MKVNMQFFYLIVALFLTGCTHTQVWEKAGSNQQSFNLDSRECELFAQQVALQQSETGKRADPVFFNKVYTECLGAKGWRIKTNAAEPDKEDVLEPVQQLAQSINSNSVKGFGQTITVPDSYRLVVNKQFQIGLTVIHQFFWKGEDSSFINILFQENKAAPFEQIPYPVSEPYMLYTSGKGEKALERLQWATFFGYIEPDWIMGTGAYYYASKKQRIIVAITKPLIQPTGEMVPNVTLSRDQFLEIEKFSDQWQIWLDQQFQQGPGRLKKFIKALNFGV